MNRQIVILELKRYQFGILSLLAPVLAILGVLLYQYLAYGEFLGAILEDEFSIHPAGPMRGFIFIVQFAIASFFGILLGISIAVKEIWMDGAKSKMIYLSLAINVLTFLLFGFFMSVGFIVPL